MLIILMYHTIKEAGAGPLLAMEDPYYTLTPEAFEEQMRWLKEVTKSYPYTLTGTSGHKPSHRVTSLLEALGSAQQRDNSSQIVLTFDDGLKSHYDVVRPILEKYGFIGHFFINAENIWQPGYMGWDEVIELKKAGHIIGSHGMFHRILTALDKDGLAREIRVSRSTISGMIKGAVDYFSVPGGFYDGRIEEIARQAGYKAVLTSTMGINNGRGFSPYRLKRIAVKKDTSIDKLNLIIEQGRLSLGDRLKYFSKKALQKIIGDKNYHRFRRTVLHC